MNEWQLGLFDAPPPSQRGSETSRQAAVAIEPTVGSLRAKVLDHIRSKGSHGATDEEIQKALEMNPSTQRPRRIELVSRGLVVAGITNRKTSSGRNASVWIAKEFAK